MLSILAAARFPLTGSMHERLNRVLASRRAGEAETLERQAETEQLEKMLI